MKLTKLSLIAIIAVNAAVAGGDIVEIETPSEACNSNTTINGKLQGYYITNDATDDMFGDQSQLGFAATLDVSHKFNNWLTANFSAIGYVNAFKQPNMIYMEGNKNGAFFNVANLTATFGDTTFVAGRQLLDTPMLGSFDWLLAPSAFEAYTLVNTSIENVTLVASYVRTLRDNSDLLFGDGDQFTNLTDIGDGNNWTVGAAYDDKTISASVWYYNVDAFNYTQVYADAGYNFGSFNVAGQFASTDYGIGADSTAFAGKIETKISNFALMAAVSSVSDAAAGFVERDNFYTSSWNVFASAVAVANEDTLSWKVSASTELSGVSLETSYAGYGDDGSELDVIAAYDFSKCISMNAIFSSTTANAANADAVNALEFIATYKF